MPLRINAIDTPIDDDMREKLECYLPAKQFASNNYVMTKDIKQQYLNITKSLEYYREHWQQLVDWDYIDKNIDDIDVKQSHYLTYRELLAGIYLLCKVTDMGLFSHYKQVLLTWYNNYFEALKYYHEDGQYYKDNLYTTGRLQ